MYPSDVSVISRRCGSVYELGDPAVLSLDLQEVLILTPDPHDRANDEAGSHKDQYIGQITQNKKQMNYMDDIIIPEVAINRLSPERGSTKTSIPVRMVDIEVLFSAGSSIAHLEAAFSCSTCFFSNVGDQAALRNPVV